MQCKWDWQNKSGWIALFWLVAMVTSYYIMHKPISLEGAFSLVIIILRIMVAGSMILVSGGFGRRLLKDHPVHPLAVSYIRAGLGMGLLSLGILAAGFVRIFCKG